MQIFHQFLYTVIVQRFASNGSMIVVRVQHSFRTRSGPKPSTVVASLTSPIVDGGTNSSKVFSVV